MDRQRMTDELERVRRCGLWLLFPPLAVALAVTVIGFALLIGAFAGLGVPSPLVYLSYTLSSWALVIWVARIVRANPAASVLNAAQQNEHLARAINDERHRLGITTGASFGVDVLWTAGNALAALMQNSLWFGTLAAYYAALAIMRLPLSLQILSGSNACNPQISAHNPVLKARVLRKERTLCLTCGALLVLCTPVFAGFVILALHRQASFSYPGTLIYGAALYAFYALIGGIVRFVRHRQSSHPAVRTANALYLVVAAVSMLSLEVAMIDMFSTTSDEWFRTVMIASTGAVVCLLAIAVAIWMIRGARKEA